MKNKDKRTLGWGKHTLVARAGSDTPLEVRLNHAGVAVTVRDPASPGWRAVLPVHELRLLPPEQQEAWRERVSAQRLAAEGRGRHLIYANKGKVYQEVSA